MSKPRTAKRSRSGAATQCPHCLKLLRGNKGVTEHLEQVHGIAVQQVPSPLTKIGARP